MGEEAKSEGGAPAQLVLQQLILEVMLDIRDEMKGVRDYAREQSLLNA